MTIFFYFLFPGIELEDESEGEVISSELQKKEQERKRHQSNKNLVKTHKRTLSGGVVRTNLRPKTWLGEASPIEVPDRKIDVVTLVEIPFKIFCTSLAWYHRCILWKPYFFLYIMSPSDLPKCIRQLTKFGHIWKKHFKNHKFQTIPVISSPISLTEKKSKRFL